MSQIEKDDSSEVSVRLLDKTYRFRCPRREEEILVEAAKYLDGELRRTRNAGIYGVERLSMTTALNLAADYIAMHKEKEEHSKSLHVKVKALQQRIDDVLSNAEQLELE